MATWNVIAAGVAKDVHAVRKLLDDLAEVLGREENGTGTSEFQSPHTAAANFHVQDDQDAAGTTGSADPGDAKAGSGSRQGRAKAKS